MDDFVVTQLKTWNLDQFTERFEKAGIDQEMFFEIDDGMLDSLFAKEECGYMRKFDKRLRAHKDEISRRATNIPLENGDPNPSNENASLNRASDTSSNQDSSPTRTPLLDITNQLMTPANSVTLTPASNSSTQESQCAYPSPTISVVAVEYANQTLPLNVLFRCKYKGDRILKALDEGILKTRLIVDLVIGHEFDINKPNYSIKKERFLGWNEEIADICKGKIKKTPEAIKRIFYYVFQKSTRTTESVNAGGCMYDGYTNRRAVLILEGVIPKNQILEEDTLSTAQEGVLDWVHNNDSPPDTLLQKWKLSMTLRPFQKDFREHFRLYKGLHLPSSGHILWSSDYDQMHQNCPNFQQEFKTWAPFIIQVARDSHKLEESDDALIANGKDYIAAAICLVRLLCKRVLKRKADGLATSFGGKPEHLVESLIVNKPTIDSFNTFITTRQQDSVKDQRPIGPFVTLVGDFLNEGRPIVEGETPSVQIFVTVNSINFKVESTSLLDALDYCYKSFGSLNIPYPVETAHVWNLFQILIYKKNFQKKLEYASVRQLIDKLEEAKDA